MFSSYLQDQKAYEKGEKCPKFSKMGNETITKSRKSRHNDIYRRKSWNRRMKHLLSHFHGIQNVFTNEIFSRYQNQSRTEVIADEAISDTLNSKCGRDVDLDGPPRGQSADAVPIHQINFIPNKPVPTTQAS